MAEWGRGCRWKEGVRGVVRRTRAGISEDTRNRPEGRAAAPGPSYALPMSERREGRARSRAEGRASRDVLRARKALRGVRGFTWFVAGSNLLVGLPLVAAGPEGDLRFLTWVAFGTALVTGVAALDLYRHPVLWTTVTALLQSSSVAVGFALGRRPILGTVIAVGLWGALPLTRRALEALREEDADVVAERLSGRFRTEADASEARLRVARRSQVEGDRAWLKFGLVAGALGAAIAVGRPLYRLVTKPPAVDAGVAAWVSALESGSHAGAEALCSDDYRERWPRVTAILDREGWLAGGVELGEPEVHRSGETYHEIWFALPRGTMKTLWRLEGRRWEVDRVVFKDVKAEDDDG